MVLTQAIYIQGKILDKQKLKLADYVIQPKVSGISTVDLGRSKECIEAGVIEARNAMPKLKRMIIKRTSDYYLFK